MAGYSDDPTFTAWLTDNGFVLPDGTPAAAVLRQRGSSYIDAAYGPRFKGQPTAGYSQERAWPRAGAVVGGSAIPSDVVPLAVIHASFNAAFQIATDPESLSSVGSSAGIVKREKVEGAVEVEYQDTSKAQTGIFDPFAPSAVTPLITTVDGLLAPYLIFIVPGIGVWSVGC